MTADVPSPNRHVRPLARSQPSTFKYRWHVSFHLDFGMCCRPTWMFHTVVCDVLPSPCVFSITAVFFYTHFNIRAIYVSTILDENRINENFAKNVI